MNMEQTWLEHGIDNTIHDFDFTKRAMQNVYHVITSDDFEEMDSDLIYQYLSTGMSYNFKDFLKRYLYENAGILETYGSVEDSVYQDIVRESFKENCAPQSFSPTTKSWTSTIKGWLQATVVKRPTMFLLGFGLRMNADDVSAFLTKVLQKQDFNFYDKEEVIYWFCYKNQLKYPKAQELLQKYDALPSLLPDNTISSKTEIDKILKHKVHIERFDLITLNFFKFSQMDDDPIDRCREFIKSTNIILSGCGMNGVYPVHPYESFVLLCLLSESPLSVYADIWEMSYEV